MLWKIVYDLGETLKYLKIQEIFFSETSGSLLCQEFKKFRENIIKFVKNFSAILGLPRKCQEFQDPLMFPLLK